MVALSTLDVVQLVVLVPSAAFISWITWTHRSVAKNSPLKVVMMAWYAIAALLTIVYTPIKAELPETRHHFIMFYNAVGQLMSLTGLVDIAHYTWSTARLASLNTTRMVFMKIWAAVMVLGLVLYGIAVPLNNFGHLPLNVYRGLTLLLMMAEIGGCAFIIRRVWKNRQAKYYYAVTLMSRCGLVLGIVLRIALGATSDGVRFLIWIVHTCSVEACVLALGVIGSTSMRRIIAGNKSYSQSSARAASGRHAQASSKVAPETDAANTVTEFVVDEAQHAQLTAVEPAPPTSHVVQASNI